MAALPLRIAVPHMSRKFTQSRNLTFRDQQGCITSVAVKPWHTMEEVRTKLAHDLHPDRPCTERLFCRGHEMCYNRTVDSCKLLDTDVISICQRDLHAKHNKLEVLCGSSCPPALVSVLAAARDGLETGMSPKLTPSGLGGTYFLCDSQQQVVGVFKPEDEEVCCPNNPKGNTGDMHCPSVRKGLLSGEANLREVAAFLMDHQDFANVPATVRVEVCHRVFGQRPKVGSFQEFKPHDEEAGDLSSSLFSVSEAHKIAIMDIRLINTDRNDENLLVKRGTGSNKYELIPIDHGCSMPDQLQLNWHDWIWLSWPQMKLPFSEEEKEYIERLDVSVDSVRLQQELSIGWRSLLMFNIATTFLKKGAAADLSLFDIASMMVRDFDAQFSALESIFTQARALAETKRAGSGGLGPRRSPAIAAVVPRSPSSSSNRKVRRSNSMIELAQLTAFSLPPSVAPCCKAKDDHGFDTWDELGEEQQQESFDDLFFQCLHELMDCLIAQRASKKAALSTFVGAYISKCQSSSRHVPLQSQAAAAM